MESTVLIRESGDFPNEFKVKDVIIFHEYLRSSFDKERAHELADAFELNLNKKVEQLSRG